MSRLQLTLAVGDHDITRPLIDSRTAYDHPIRPSKTGDASA
ncbi:hypothetical protein [Actinomadura sp. NBRC 104412]|nr:hypothetical protein [Actinomadura sp. NBRC 104412]